MKLKIDKLQLDPQNANKGTDRGKKALAESLKQYGAGRSILVDKKGRVIAGNKTVEQAIAAGHKDILVVQTDGSKLVAVQRMDLDLKDKRAKALAIADNRVGELDLEWDGAVLAELGKEIDLSAFWSPGELEKLLGVTAGEAPEPQLDKAAELQKKWKTKRGQLWLIGEHRLLCGDSTNEADLSRLMATAPKGVADMVFTDPPYNVDYEGNYIQSGKILKKEEKVWSGGIENDDRSDFSTWLRGSYQAIDKFMGEGCAIYIWHPSGAEGRHFWSAWLWDMWHFQVDLVWNKMSLIIARWDYKPQHEPCMYGWKGKNRTWAGENNISTVWDIPRQQGNSGEDRNHPTQKPTALALMAIRNHEPKVTFDPFAGSGSTLCAAELSKRCCYAIEIEPKYVAVALERLSDMGLKPKLA